MGTRSSLNYWKKKLIDSLKEDTVEKSIENINIGSRLKKSMEMLKAKGYAPGTIREWGGKKFKKLSSGKWMRTYEGTNERGERQAIRNVMNKIQKAESMESLVMIIRDNRERFVDSEGNMLPVVKDFIKDARATTAGTKESKKTKYKIKKNKSESGIDKIKEKYQSGKNIAGDTDEIYVGGEEITGTWKLVEADQPSASHNEKTFHKTEGFPTNKDGSTINDRDYEKDKSAQISVNDIASNYDGRALSFDSPIVVSKDGIVISGNNRTMSSKISASKGTDKKYIKVLKKRAKKFGLSPEDIGKFKHPRVVFETDNSGDYSTQEFAKFNETSKKTMNPVESAVKVSKIITPDVIKGISSEIQEYDTMGELYANKKSVNDVFNTLQSGGIINQFTRPQYVTENGITGAGKEFLETVLVGSVINEANIRKLSKEGFKSIRKKLVRAITPLIENKSMGGYSISTEINQAVDVLAQVKGSDRFNSIDDFAEQSNMFEDKNNISIELAKKMEMKEKDFADFMQSLNGKLEMGASGQADIFFGNIESKEDVLERMLNIKKSRRLVIRRK